MDNVVNAVSPSTNAWRGRGFNSFKCLTPIEYTRRCSRDALIQATLDRHVAEIRAVPLIIPGAPDAFFTFAVSLGDKRCLIQLCDQTNGVTFPVPPGFELGLCLGRDHILADPTVTTCRMVWSHRAILVPPLFELQLNRQLSDRSDGVELEEIAEEAQATCPRWLDFTLALACQGKVTLDNVNRIEDRTRIFRGSHSTGPNSGAPFSNVFRTSPSGVQTTR